MAVVNDPAILLARAAKLKLFIMLRRTEKPAELAGAVGAHLRWMIEQEKAGLIFLSGPVAAGAGPTALDGLTIIRVPDMAAAEALARQDPFIKAGIVSYEMREWTVNEGALPLFVTLSDSSVSIR